METIESKYIQEKIYKEVLPNGLKVYYCPNDKIDSFFLVLNTNFGAKDVKFKYEDEEEFHETPRGLAHFLEHITFKLEGIDAGDLYNKLGVNCNAATSDDMTRYIAYGNTHVYEALDTLLYYVYTPYYTEETVANEKNIIKEECKRCNDNINRVFYFEEMRSLFKNYNHSQEIVGSLTDIDSITLEHIKDAYEYFYHPANMSLTIVGNFDIKKAGKVINKRLSTFNFKEHKNVIKFKPEEPVKVNKEIVRKKERTSVNRASYLIKVPMSTFDDLGLSEKEILAYVDLIFDSNFGNTSLFSDELYKNNIVAHFTGVSTYIVEDYLIIGFENDPYDVDKFIDTIDKYLNKIELNEKDINRMIKSGTSHYIMSFDNIRSVAYSIAYDDMRFGEYKNDYVDIYKRFEIKMGEKILKSIDLKNKTIVVYTPVDK